MDNVYDFGRFLNDIVVGDCNQRYVRVLLVLALSKILSVISVGKDIE
jgi:hypothetical protein